MTQNTRTKPTAKKTATSKAAKSKTKKPDATQLRDYDPDSDDLQEIIRQKPPRARTKAYSNKAGLPPRRNAVRKIYNNSPTGLARVGALLREARETYYGDSGEDSEKLPIEKLSDMSGINTASIHYMEAGVSKSLTLESLFSLAAVLKPKHENGDRYTVEELCHLILDYDPEKGDRVYSLYYEQLEDTKPLEEYTQGKMIQFKKIPLLLVEEKNGGFIEAKARVGGFNKTVIVRDRDALKVNLPKVFEVTLIRATDGMDDDTLYAIGMDNETLVRYVKKHYQMICRLFPIGITDFEKLCEINSL